MIYQTPAELRVMAAKLREGIYGRKDQRTEEFIEEVARVLEAAAQEKTGQDEMIEAEFVLAKARRQRSA